MKNKITKINLNPCCSRSNMLITIKIINKKKKLLALIINSLMLEIWSAPINSNLLSIKGMQTIKVLSRQERQEQEMNSIKPNLTLLIIRSQGSPRLLNFDNKLG